jgi:hypothetical protein
MQEVPDHVHREFAWVRDIGHRPHRAVHPVRPGHNQRGREKDESFVARKSFGVVRREPGWS